MPNASFYFLLSFCFRKVVRGSFSESVENYMNYFYEETKTEPEGGLQGAHMPQMAPGAANT